MGKESGGERKKIRESIKLKSQKKNKAASDSRENRQKKRTRGKIKKIYEM